MLDFLNVKTKTVKKNTEIYPNFIMKNPSSDLMIRGGDFYAIWLEEKGVWSTNEQDAIELIDKEVSDYIEANNLEGRQLYMWDSESGIIDRWHKYCQKQMRDSYHMLDENLIFANDIVNKKDYASKRLNYPLEPGETPAWDKLIGTLYAEEERHKIEWAIGAVVSGDSKRIQKFLVFYGAPGTGKGTILKILQDQLFKGYCAAFNAKALGSNNNVFALEMFKNNPLVAIQQDGDLSRIEDNSTLNSLVSHETLTVNEKYKATYAANFNSFLFLGTNKPVKITDAKSGLLRRLIDVHPSGQKIKNREYNELLKMIPFELGKIAYNCREIYLADPDYYDDYIPLGMMGASNDFFNFMMEHYHIFKRDDGTTLKSAWEMYKVYCEEANVPYKASKMKFKEELKNYFLEYKDRTNLEDGSRVSSYYSGFRTDKFETDNTQKKKPSVISKSLLPKWLEFTNTSSIFDLICADCFAQYTTKDGVPKKAWSNVKTKLKDLRTDEIHYVKVPENHIVIDFDLKNEKGEKDVDLNLKAASTWPETYMELSKSGAGVHLHYIYNGDVSKLSRVYDENIEVKVFTGNSSLRRKLTKHNNNPIATISSGLPLKTVKKMIDKKIVQTEKGIRTTMKKCLAKEIHANTTQNVSFIKEILDQAYESGISYDVRDMYNDVVAFAMQSTNQSDNCLKMVSNMTFCSKDIEELTMKLEQEADQNERPIVFYDCEVFPNLFLICWKFEGSDSPVVRMINPKPNEIEELLQYRLIGFNCRRYDNHMLHACLMGYSNKELYEYSQKIVTASKGARNVFFGTAYNYSYTDVYDFASSSNKKSLKALEIEMGIHHLELGLPWDEPVPEKLWPKVAEYCDNDVIATEAAFHYLSADWNARLILSDLAGMSPNSTTNSLTTKIIFDLNRSPQNEFCYRDLSKEVYNLDPEVEAFLNETFPEMMAEKFSPLYDDIPFGGDSLLPYFPGYTFENNKSVYREEAVGEGGYVYAKHGMYWNVALLDVSSMHPHSIMTECLFGPKFTKIFRNIVYGRVSIKHESWSELNDILDGKLLPYVEKVQNGEMKSKDLANALKTAINSVYGLTDAKFDNPFRDRRNVDNIVAKRGALFMVDLKHAVEEKGFTVAHIKTDSIKIPNATPEIIEFVMEFGKRYGYTFEHEATYNRMCLVNDAVYIAKYETAERCEEMYGYIPDDCNKYSGKWTATGKQFAVPYVFKTLFTHDDITFEDMCETYSASTALYLDLNENKKDVTKEEKTLKSLRKKYHSMTEEDDPKERDGLKREISELEKYINDNHVYNFVGKVGNFCPMNDGVNAGELCRIDKDPYGNDTYSYPSGAKGYRWLESEIVRNTDMINEIDKSFYNHLVDDAVEAISKHGDFEMFVTADFNEADDQNPPWYDKTPFDVR